MKRFLLLFCAAVLACSILIVPAFAAESYILEFQGTGSDYDFNLPAGSYYLKAVSASDSVLFETPTFDYSGQGLVNLTFSQPDGKIIRLELGKMVGDITFSFFGDVCDSNEEECEIFDFVYPISVLEFVPVTAETEPVSPAAGIFGVFTGVGSWISGQLGATTSLFWTGESLTFLGVLSVCATAIALILLLIAVVVRFLRFGG